MNKGNSWHRFLSEHEGKGLSINEISEMYHREKRRESRSTSGESNDVQDGFTKTDLKEYKEVQTWLRTVSKTTRLSYLNALKKFCNWCGEDPHRLILMRDEEKDIKDPNKRNRTKNMILDFRKRLEEESYAPSSINSMDGAIRGFYSSVLGREGMVNVSNYEHRDVTQRKDLVPTLEELKKLLDVPDIDTKFSIIFLAQTGMRPGDALDLDVGDIQRELNLGNSPLAIRFLPKKDRNKGIGERITFLGSDGVKILKDYLKAREGRGEELTLDSPLFVSRSGGTITKQWLNGRIKKASEKARIENGNNGKYGRVRLYSLRKFFMTQLTNHGMEDRIVNFFMCHKVSPVDLAYWQRRVEQLREEYRKREKFLNPISGTSSKPSSGEIENLIGEKLKDFVQSEEFKEACSRVFQEIENDNCNQYDSLIVESEEKIIKLSNKGYDCQPLGDEKWLMKKEISGED